jgi:hypothetical protein
LHTVEKGAFEFYLKKYIIPAAKGATMTEKTVDLRKFKRIFFEDSDHTEGAVVIEGMGVPVIPVKFMNLSEGGVSFQAARSLCQKISWDKVVMLQVEQTGLLAFLNNLQVEVRYVLDFDIVPQVTFGCQFVELPQTILNEIRMLVEAKYRQ